MKRVVIRHTLAPEGSPPLTFGLIDVLEALGPRAATGHWRAASLLYTTTDDQAIEALERASTGAFVPGDEILAARARLAQVIDGDLEGYIGSERWVIVRAIDGGRWEVASDDPAVLTAVARRFSVLDGAAIDIE